MQRIEGSQTWMSVNHLHISRASLEKQRDGSNFSSKQVGLSLVSMGLCFPLNNSFMSNWNIALKKKEDQCWEWSMDRLSYMTDRLCTIQVVVDSQQPHFLQHHLSLIWSFNGAPITTVTETFYLPIGWPSLSIFPSIRTSPESWVQSGEINPGHLCLLGPLCLWAHLSDDPLFCFHGCPWYSQETSPESKFHSINTLPPLLLPSPTSVSIACHRECNDLPILIFVGSRHVAAFESIFLSLYLYSLIMEAIST